MYIFHYINNKYYTSFVSCLSESNASKYLYAHLLLLYESKSECVFTCVHDYISSDSVL